jgi:hypothetical protein
MTPLAIIVVWGGYGLASYGYILGRGWNITPRQWFSPLNPYKWPAGGQAPPTIPKGQLWAGKAPTSGGGTTAAQDATA